MRLADKLAIDGGAPARTEPFPSRDLFGPDDAAELMEALQQGTLFFPSGKKVYEFQQAFGELYGSKHVITSTSGTAAIHVALGAINPEPGDEAPVDTKYENLKAMVEVVEEFGRH